MARLVPGSYHKQEPIYGAVLREEGGLVWRCPHYHKTSAEARECAKVELDRRRVEREKK
jgi:hypothetical protein